MPRSEVMAVATGPMHGRLVTLSSVRSQPVYLSRDDAEQLMNDAFDLVPSLLRARGTEAEPQDNSTHPEPVFVTRAVAHGRPPTLVDRIRLALDRPPPEPGRARNRYVPAQLITRGWVHKSVREHDTDERKRRVSRCPPQYGRTELVDVDTTDIRRRELRRVLRAALYLRSLTESYDGLYDLCGEVIVVCREALHRTDDDGTPLTEPENRERYGQALVTVRDLILARPDHQRTWANLRPERESIRDVLTSDNRTVLAAAVENQPELLTLYGHNLFLALLVAMTKAGDGPTAATVSLWRTVAQWQLYQIGFKPADLPQYMARPMYDIGSVCSGLISRAKRIYRALQPVGIQGHMVISETQVSHRLGLAFSAGVDEPLWMLLPTSEGGHAIGLTGSIMLGTWWMKCVTNLEELRAAAEEMLDTFDIEKATPLLVTHYEDTQLLSLWDEENEVWNTMGALSSRLIRRRHEHQLDWLSIDVFSSGMRSADSTEVPRPDSRDLGVAARRLLRRLAEQTEESVWVGCSVSIDPDKKVYRVVFSSDDTEVQTFTTESTETLVRTLREPQYVQLRDKEERVMHWDPKTDITYDSTGPVRLQVESPLKFRRLIPCPRTAAELLSAEVGRDVTLAILEQEARRDRTFVVRLEGVSEGSALRDPEKTSLTSTEICMLCAYGELFDPEDSTRHKVSIDASHVTDVRLLHNLMSDELQSSVVGLEREIDEEETCRDDWAEMPYEEGDETEKVPETDDREMQFVSAEAYTKQEDRERRVRIWVTPVDGSGDLTDRVVVRHVTDELTMSRGEVEVAVGRSLRGLRLSESEVGRAGRAVVRTLRSEGVRVVGSPDQ